MVSGAPTPGGYRKSNPGGFSEPTGGGISFADNRWRAYSGHKNVDYVGSLVASGARATQTRSIANIRTEAGTTATSIAWTLPTVPGGSTTAVGSITGGTTATAAFTPDVAGTYVFRATVTFTGANAPNTFAIDYTYVSA